MFQPIKLIKVFQQKYSQSATNGASKKATKNQACLHRLLTWQTKMAVVHKVTLLEYTRPLFLRCTLSLQDSLYWWCTPILQGCYLFSNKYQAYETYYLSSVHKITLPSIRIELMRLITSIARAHQVYKVSQNLQKYYSNCLVVIKIKLLELLLQG